MLHVRSSCTAAFVVAAILAACRIAEAETCTLELKRLETTPTTSPRVGAGQDWLYRSVSSQSFSMRLGVQGNRPDEEEQFRKIVKKEPAKYVSKEPLRAVAKLGSGQFPFVLDAKDEKSRPYGRLYFDLNGNGDLTDDKPIDAAADRSPRVTGSSNYSYCQFPRVDLSIPVEGKSQEYSFLFTANSYGSTDYRYVQASLSAGAYRTGEITLEGKKHTLALLDYTSNGRFDDLTNIPGNVHYSGGGIYAQMGDMLLIDPGKAVPSNQWGYGYGDENRQHLSKLAKIGDKFYDVKVSPNGDQLTLTPSTLKIGYLNNPSGPFTAVIYGDHGFLPIRGQKDKPAAVPEGQWKLLSCQIAISGWKPPPAPKTPEKKEEAKPEKKDADKKKGKSGGLLESLAQALFGSKSSPSTSAEPMYGPPGVSMVDAHGTEKGKAVTVRAAETVAMPFGPPYKPVVEAHVGQWASGGQADLSMSLVGSGGETVSNLTINGRRPNKPEFSIRDSEGEVVDKGTFEYG